MLRLAFLATVALCGACKPAYPPGSLRTVEAVEIPITNAADRSDLIAILRRHAGIDGGMHVDEVSREWRNLEAQSATIAPNERGTIFVGVWRGVNDDNPEAEINDSGHPGRVWLTFARGKLPSRSSAFRNGVMQDVMKRWPSSKNLPILSGGNIPLAKDMKLTSRGYRIDPAAAPRYGLPVTSPVVAR